MTIKSEQARLRDVMPRRRQAELILPADRDPLRIIEEQHATRLQELIPIQIGRMLESPFALYRGTAGVMAADLADAPTTGVEVVSCGDAHISNFGFFASPERTLLFDLNDFDEAGVAPWEWDLKRLAASVHIAARHIGMSESAARDTVVSAVAAYRDVLARLAQLTSPERYYLQVDSIRVQKLIGSAAAREAKREASKARTRTSERLIERLTTRQTQGGPLRIEDQPPIAVHVDHASTEELADLFRQYRSVLREDIAYLLERYTVVDFVLRVVGVGSVGTRCFVVALEDPDGHVLFLQVKEAGPGVLARYGHRTRAIPGVPEEQRASNGRRVVAGQRILQAQSDPFLGWVIGWAGERSDRPRVDFYIRQFHDMKGSIDPAALTPAELRAYSALCAQLLARAQSQSPHVQLISAYLGRADTFDRAIAAWAAGYADVAERDYEALRKAVAAGRFPIAA